jgi:hypothetical protein
MNDMDVRSICEKAMVLEVGLRLDTTLGEIIFKPGFILSPKEITGYDNNDKIDSVRYEDILSAETL